MLNERWEGCDLVVPDPFTSCLHAGDILNRQERQIDGFILLQRHVYGESFRKPDGEYCEYRDRDDNAIYSNHSNPVFHGSDPDLQAYLGDTISLYTPTIYYQNKVGEKI